MRPGLLLLLVTLLLPWPARAYSTQSAFRHPCHEWLTLAALERAPWPVAPTLPEGWAWRGVHADLLQAVGVDVGRLGDEELFLLGSLLLGVRAPDLEGHSITDVRSARVVGADPSAEAQHRFALRGAEDDGPEGDAAVVDGLRDHLEAMAARIAEAGERGAVTRIPVSLDFYGRIQVEVWEPAYLAGRSVHSLQDSFSHMIRSDAHDLRRVVHVTNYVDALRRHHHPERDGLAHSHTLDRCDLEEAGELYEATITASASWLGATTASDPDATRAVLDEWLVLEPGCTAEDDYCGNGRWVELARRDPTVAGLRDTCAVGHAGGGWGALVALLAAVALTTRASARRRRRRR